jgi:TolB-like protein
MRHAILIGSISLLAVAGWSTVVSASAGDEPSRGRYFYDFPRQMPDDYVYRTGDIFFPAPGPNSGAIIEGEQGNSGDEFHGQRLMAMVGALARQLLANAEEEVADDFIVAVSSFVNLNDLYRTSALGRYISEQLMGELQMAGVSIVELRRTPSILISRGQGEFNLSRDMNELAFIHYAHATLVGTYTVVENQLMLNTRLLRNRDNKVLSSGALVVPLDSVTKGLLADETSSAARGATVQIRAYQK